WIINFFKRVVYGQNYKYRAWVISFNTRLVVWTSLVLLVFSTVAMLIFEYDHALAEHRTWWGKLVSAFFMGNSSRTAGFNVSETGGLSMPMLMVMMFLMWVGASPGSTGGGIKTTT